MASEVSEANEAQRQRPGAQKNKQKQIVPGGNREWWAAPPGAAHRSYNPDHHIIYKYWPVWIPAWCVSAWRSLQTAPSSSRSVCSSTCACTLACTLAGVGVTTVTAPPCFWDCWSCSCCWAVTFWACKGDQNGVSPIKIWQVNLKHLTSNDLWP